MKYLFIILLSLAFVSLQAQPPGFTPQKNKLAPIGIGVTGYFAMPSDTFVVTTPYKTFAWLATKNDVLYRYSSGQDKWIPLRDSGLVVWGDVTGPITNQLDLKIALDAKQDTLPTTGTSGDYFAGDFTLQNFSSSVTTVTDPLYAPKDSLHTWIFELPLYLNTGTDTNTVKVHYETPVWNADKLQNYEIEPGEPDDGSYLVYSTASHRWTHSVVPAPMAYNNKIMGTYAAYSEDRTVKAMQRLYEMILDLRKQIEALKK
jgi:hypothetical protein